MVLVLHLLTFPPYTAGCRPEDGGDGKCGSPDGYLKKAVNADFPKTHPDAAAMFQKTFFLNKSDWCNGSFS